MARHVFDLNDLWNRIVSYVNDRLQSLSDLTDDDIREVCDFEDGMDENAVVPKATADMLGCVKVGDGLNVDENGVLSNPAVDYIVEQGRSGNWTWKKWASGEMEVWGKQTPTVTGTTNNFSIAMPVTFVNTEYMVNMTPGHNGSIVTKYGDYNANGNMEHGYGYFVFGFTVSSKYNVTWNFIIKGRWK